MDDLSVVVTARLRRALGIGDGAPVGSADAAAHRDREDAALTAWAAAIAEHDRTVRDRDQALRRATAAIHRAMRPLEPSYYERIEACLAAENWTALARFDGRNVARVVATRDLVQAARARLDDATTAWDWEVESAWGALRRATDNLVSVLGFHRASAATGVGRRRLSASRADR